jgi:O-antigen ligase
MQASIHTGLFVLGFSAFLPHGLSNFAWLVILLLWLVSREQRQQHLAYLPPRTIMVLLGIFALWPFVVVAYSGSFTDTATRLFHMVRVALMLQMGLMITPAERLTAFKGLVWGAAFTSLVVVIHRFHPLPEWAIWHHLLAVKGSQSSRAMIMLALSAGVCMVMGFHAWRGGAGTFRSAAWLLAAFALAAIVGVFSISRNAQMVLITLPVLLLVYQYRSQVPSWCLSVGMSFRRYLRVFLKPHKSFCSCCAVATAKAAWACGLRCTRWHGTAC